MPRYWGRSIIEPDVDVRYVKSLVNKGHASHCEIPTTNEVASEKLFNLVSLGKSLRHLSLLPVRSAITISFAAFLFATVCFFRPFSRLASGPTYPVTIAPGKLSKVSL